VDPVRQIADAVLYEGYVLWPYRRSALKNTRRWTFGGVYPREHSERHPDDPSTLHVECLLEGGPGATVDVAVRFLHVVRRQVVRGGPGAPEPVDELTVAGTRYLSWDEATERELGASELALGELGRRPHQIPVLIRIGWDREELPAEEPARAGDLVPEWRRRAISDVSGGCGADAIVRTSCALCGTIDVAATSVGPELTRLSVEIVNTTPMPWGTREQALQRSFCSTHVVLHAHGASFVSLTDPPPRLREHAGACRNEGAWPVLVGEPGERHALLASPIILEDYPRVAPESPGDLFDGGEIDQLLTLNILSLSDAEKAEMRDSDPRVRAILERTEALSEEELMGLHGAIRDLRQAP
jgi:hydrogenase maturation protease